MAKHESWVGFLAVLVFVGAGAAVLAVFYGLHVGLLVLGYYYVGLHVRDLQHREKDSVHQVGTRSASGRAGG